LTRSEQSPAIREEAIDMSSPSLGLNSLVYALLEKARNQNIRGPRAEYADARYTALMDLLGVAVDPFDDTAEPVGSSFAVLGLMSNTMRKLAWQISPFAGYLEAPSSVIDLYQRHGDRFTAIDQEISIAVRELLADCYRVLVPGIDERTTTEAELSARGVDPRPPKEWDQWDELSAWD
jgi:hypothetical protein